MCRHNFLISKNTGELIKSEDMTAEDFKNNSYICNDCKALFEFKNGVLIREIQVRSAN